VWVYGARERRQMPWRRLSVVSSFVEVLGQMTSIVFCNPLIRRAAEMDRQLLFSSTIEKLPDVSREPSDGG